MRDAPPDLYDRHPGATAEDLYGPAEPTARRRLTPAEADRAARTEFDPYAPHMVAGVCTGCGGRVGHATVCPYNPANPTNRRYQ